MSDVASALRAHPLVRAAQVVGATAYVVVDAVEAMSAEQQRAYLNRWAGLYDRLYGGAATADPTFNTATWTSSYTRQPIPADEMREWVEGTVARIRALAPRRVLELGCGTGMLLARVAPHCERYVGLDASSAAIAYVAAHIAPGLPQVELVRGFAHELEANGAFDVVVINSVTQCLPSAAYLLDVLAHAIAAVGEGGTVFVGDVRDARLARLLHTSIALVNPPGELAALRDDIDRRVARDEELLIDPALFAQLPGVRYAQIELRRGRHHNELTGYRYDAILHVGTRAPRELAIERVAWGDDARARIAASTADAVIVADIPNARVHAAAYAADRLATAASVAELAAPSAGVDPEALATLGEGHGFRTGLTWGATPGVFDVVLVRDGVDPEAVWTARAGAPRPIGELTTRPLRRVLAAQIVRELRRALGAELPADVELVVVDQLPAQKPA